MKLLQLNAWGLRLSTNVANLIKHEAPDIVAFQEVFDADIETGFFPTLTEFMETIRFHHTYYSPVYAYELMHEPLQFGNAIVSNLTLKDQYTEFTNKTFVDDFIFKRDDYNIRNFQHVVAEDEQGKPFHVINHHGYHVPGHKKGNEFTLKACQQILDYTASLEGPIIIAGDFNLEPGSESLALLDNAFRNLSTEHKLTTTRTFHTNKTEVCDYIFVNDGITVRDFYGTEEVASDHVGLVLEFEVA
jgi:endonuclease/exonuclease/phosphatase family metal-dependent hydrolase